MSWWPHQAPVPSALWLGQVMVGNVANDAVAEHTSALDDPREVRDRLPVVLEPLLQLGVAQAVEQEDVRRAPASRAGPSITISSMTLPSCRFR